MHLEIAEHLVRLAGDGVTINAAGLSEDSTAPRFCDAGIAECSPRANRSIGAVANVSEISNSAIAFAIISNVIGPPFATAGSSLAKILRYSASALIVGEPFFGSAR